jgi:homoserine dehydrogenase
MEPRVARVALLGAGTVGSALVGVLLDPTRRAALEEAIGGPFALTAIAVRDLAKPRPGVPADLLTTNLEGVVESEVDVIVELMGGVDETYPLVRRALERGVSVVTANKALIAAHGTALEALAASTGADLLFEAAVAGGIPIVRALRTSLIGERIQRVLGIVNGTTNFILTAMTERGADYEAVLAEAQQLGYAEADPTADVEGFDAASKITILAALSFGTPLEGAAIARTGISGVTATDVAFATRHGYVIKLLAVAERIGASSISLRVQPTLVPMSHPLASVNGAMNAVFVEGAAAGPLMWEGAGAGGRPTASAVVGDVVEALRNRATGRRSPFPEVETSLSFFSAGELQHAFYLTVAVVDRPGVLAAVTTVFGEHGVSIRSMEQTGAGDEAQLLFTTHVALTSDMQATLEDLQLLDVVESLGVCLPILEVAT